MGSSPRFAVYCNARRAGGLALVFILLLAAQPQSQAQLGRRTASKGPRALGLLEVDSKKMAHLLPVAIMINGEFYDAGIYKAAPVPMALEPGTVYEVVETGKSKGFFTVEQPILAMGSWIAGGTWDSGEAAAAKPATPPKAPTEPADAPPVLKRRGSEVPDQPTPPAPPAAVTPAPEPAAPAAPVKSSPPEPVAEDPNRPVLRRGKPSRSQSGGDLPSSVPLPQGNTCAISDAGGPDPRSYASLLKPEEQEKPKQVMLAMAEEEVKASMARSQMLPAGKAASARPPAPKFEDVKFRTVDVASNNEPVFVLTAQVLVTPPGTPDKQLQYFVALVAREDIYGEIHKSFSRTTDSRFTYATPRFEFVDVVDADGDGYGELLFRKIYDSGQAFDIYRVVGNQLYPLFEGKHQ